MRDIDLGTSGRRERIDHLRGMLGTLEQIAPRAPRAPAPRSVSALMEDIVHLLRYEALDPDARFEAGQRRIVVQSLDDLEHEVSRPDPDPSQFDRQAQILIDVLGVA